MTTFKTISSSYIIQRLFANHTVNNGNWENDAVDWVGQAIRFIGKHVGFDKKVMCKVKVENHMVCYPCDMEGLLAVVYKGQTLPLGTDLSGVGIQYTRRDQGLIQSDDDITKLKGYQDQLAALEGLYAFTPTQEIADRINYVSGLILSLEASMAVFSVYSNGRRNICEGEYYNTKLDVIQTSFECGEVDLIYNAFKIDENGNLCIIDDEYYIQAIEWYLIMIMIQKGYSHPIFTWREAYNMFWGDPNNFRNVGWRARAANRLKVPSIDNMERLTRMMERFAVDRAAYLRQFRNLEQRVGVLY